MSKCTRGEIYSCARVQALEGHQRGSIRAAWELPEWNKRGTSSRWLRGRHRQARGDKGEGDRPWPGTVSTGHGCLALPGGSDRGGKPARRLGGAGGRSRNGGACAGDRTLSGASELATEHSFGRTETRSPSDRLLT